MTWTDGKIYCVHGLEELILLQWPDYSRQFADSMQSLSKEEHFFFHRIKTNNIKICMETQKTPNSQHNLDK